MFQKIRYPRYPKITKAKIVEALERISTECKRTGGMMPLDIFPTRLENNRLVGYIFDQPEYLYETDGLIVYRSQPNVGTIEILMPRQAPKRIVDWEPSKNYFNTINPPQSDGK